MDVSFGSPPSGTHDTANQSRKVAAQNRFRHREQRAKNTHPTTTTISKLPHKIGSELDGAEYAHPTTTTQSQNRPPQNGSEIAQERIKHKLHHSQISKLTSKKKVQNSKPRKSALNTHHNQNPKPAAETRFQTRNSGKTCCYRYTPITINLKIIAQKWVRNRGRAR